MACVWTCGDASNGKCGISTRSALICPPVRIEYPESVNPEPVIAMACVAPRHTMLLGTCGRLFVFGEGTDGQLGLGTRESVAMPTQLVITKPKLAAAPSADGTDADGRDADDRAGPGRTPGPAGTGSDSRTEQMDVPVKIVQVSAATFHSAAVSDQGDLFMWGELLYGKCGLRRSTGHRLEPEHVPMSEPVRLVACGEQHTLLLGATGRVYALGSGLQGRLGLGHELDQTEPQHVSAIEKRATRIACGAAHSLVLTDTGVVLSFGCGGDGRLGHGTVQNEFTPRPIEDEQLAEVTDVACGSRHSAARTAAGQLFAWGRADDGRLGYRARLDSRRPQPVELDGRAVAGVSLGDAHTVGVTADGRAYVWGGNLSGQLGLPPGDVVMTSKPTLLDAFEGRTVIGAVCGGRNTVFWTSK